MIYWDNNATTRPSDEVIAAMMPYLTERFLNPSAGYAAAREVRGALDVAAECVAGLLRVSPGELVFTSGGTESTNTAFRSMVANHPGRGIVVLSTDHDASLRTAQALGNEPCCPVDAQGLADEDAWRQLCKSRPAGVSFAWANNETGVVQDAEKLVGIAHEYDVCVHVDAVQCVGKMPVDVRSVGADFASVSAHKFHGPKGVGCLYRRAGTLLTPLLTGGGQEHRLRSGTENVPGIVGMGRAALSAAEREEWVMKEGMARRLLLEGLLSEIGGVQIHSGAVQRLWNTSHVAFDGCTAEALMLLLEPQGLLCSAGSACHTLEPAPSHVLLAMGVGETEARSSLRLSMPDGVTVDEVSLGAELIKAAVVKVRAVQSNRTGPVLVYKP